jgi:hypothetical protein
VLVKSGPSYESRRAEALGKLLEIAKYDKEFFIKYADILFKNMDFDGADDMAARARAGMPPAILAASNPTNGDTAGAGQNPAVQVAQMHQQMQQMDALIKQLQQEKASDEARIQAQGHVDLFKLEKTHEHEKAMKLLDIQAKASDIQAKGQVDTGLIGTQAQADAQLDVLEGHIDTFHLALDHDHETSRNDHRDLSPRSFE